MRRQGVWLAAFIHIVEKYGVACPPSDGKSAGVEVRAAALKPLVEHKDRGLDPLVFRGRQGVEVPTILLSWCIMKQDQRLTLRNVNLCGSGDPLLDRTDRQRFSRWSNGCGR